jgi:hypothetical protein
MAVAMILVGSGARFLPGLSAHGRVVVMGVSLPVLIAGWVFLLGPGWDRARKNADDEIRRNPMGNAVSLDERLQTVQRPRLRWTLSAVLAVAFAAATARMIYLASSTGRSDFVGLAIMFFVPLPFLCWFAWRTRALLHKRTSRD